jgi:hypothetical protein
METRKSKQKSPAVNLHKGQNGHSESNSRETQCDGSENAWKNMWSLNGSSGLSSAKRQPHLTRGNPQRAVLDGTKGERFLASSFQLDAENMWK